MHVHLPLCSGVYSVHVTNIITCKVRYNHNYSLSDEYHNSQLTYLFLILVGVECRKTFSSLCTV